MPQIWGVVIVIAVVGTAYLLVGTGSASGQAMPDTDNAGSYNSDGSLTGSPITSDQSTWPGSDKVWDCCQGIALAEGYNQGLGTIPYDYNNPGDITDSASQYGSGTNGITTFPTAEVGWQALYNKLSNIINGGSSTYPSTWTWQQVGNLWAGGDSNWATNVCNYLGVDPSTTPAQYAQG
jgi:hypothetical protein